MNRQEVFDTALNHMRQQGKRAGGKYGCSYRTPDGLKCAVGALIPDENYDPEIEGLTANREEVVASLPFEIDRAAGDDKFLRQLQLDLHDGNIREDFLAGLERYAELFATEWGLTYAHP